jgi:maleylacetoacetate isomerase
MRFYGYYRSSAAYRCRIAFNLKGVTPETVFVHLAKGEQKQPEFLKKNPQGLLPTLEVEGRVLTQSLAIMEWLEETKPTPALLPKAPLDRAHVRALALALAADTHPLHNVRVLNALKAEFGLGQAQVDSWIVKWIGGGLKAYEATIAAAGTAGKFSFGDTPTLADICLMPQVFAADRFKVDISGLAHIQRIKSHCEALPAFANAHPAKQPDFEA